MSKYPSDIAFTPAVKTIQTEKGSRSSYHNMEERGGWQTTVTSDLASFLSELDMFYLGTSNGKGQPYIQYRGGSPRAFSILVCMVSTVTKIIDALSGRELIRDLGDRIPKCFDGSCCGFSQECFEF